MKLRFWKLKLKEIKVIEINAQKIVGLRGGMFYNFRWTQVHQMQN